MNVWHLVFRTDSLTYTIAKALSFGGHDVFVWVVDPAQDPRAAEGIQKRLRDTPRVTIVARDETRLPSEIDRLIVQVFPRPTESIRHVHPLARRARRITLITAGDRSRSWQSAMRQQALEARRLALHGHKIDRILYKDGFHPRDLLGLFKDRSAVGFDVHSQFLHDEELCRAMHARDWNPQARRPILANFLGSRDPAVRARALGGVRPFFAAGSAVPPSAPTAKSLYWHEYSDADPIGIPPREFVNVLTQSDFTLCPRGYSLVTHRPMEALLRGSIPVLSVDEVDLYGLELEDGVNCVGVPAARWPETLQRIARIEEDRIVRMRTGVLAMYDEQLRYEAVAKGIRTRLGIEN
jgi:hypothetical protein